jgi:5-methyltetrahydrofolate--homocysteine methyltransferase
MIIIGEKLNGFVKNTAAAIQNRDEAFLRALALDQANAGADYIDVCAANGETEAATLQWLAALAEEASGVPVCLDSPNPEVIAAVLPHCKREGVVNSVSLESGKIDTLFPLLAHTNWKVVAPALLQTQAFRKRYPGGSNYFEQILDAAKRYEID